MNWTVAGPLLINAIVNKIIIITIKLMISKCYLVLNRIILCPECVCLLKQQAVTMYTHSTIRGGGQVWVAKKDKNHTQKYMN